MKNSADLISVIWSIMVTVAIILGIQSNGGRLSHLPPATSGPTAPTTLVPTFAPTLAPTLVPTLAPTLVPTLAPTTPTTLAPTVSAG